MSRRTKNHPPEVPEIPQANVNIDLSSTPNIVCDECGYFAFLPVVTFKQISAIVSPTGKAGLVPVPTYMCAQCGFISPKMMPFPLVIPEEAEEKPLSSIIQTSI